MKKILTVIGARPQFIKAAPFSTAAQKLGIQEILLHTGQHYDYRMSEIFFDELEIPKPKYNLNIAGGTHGQMTGEMLRGIEEVLLSHRPDSVMVYGDTNSTLAGALAASKLQIPVIHIEAGLRSWNRQMPEEINRVMTDHLSSQLFCSSSIGVDNLAAEGITEGVHCEGDIMFDANRLATEIVSNDLEKYLRGVVSPEMLSQEFTLMTIHRAESTDPEGALERIVSAVNLYDLPVILPLHPRTRKKLSELRLKFHDHVTIIDPVGYLGMTAFLYSCSRVLTDSGGLQKEAYWLAKPCVTLRAETEWLETVKEGCNVLWSPTRSLQESFGEIRPDSGERLAYGDGKTAEKICAIIGQS